MYDVVLLDIIMPNMDGDVAAKEIRDLGFGGALIAVTNSTVLEDHDRFLRAGGNKVIYLSTCLYDVISSLFSPISFCCLS